MASLVRYYNNFMTEYQDPWTKDWFMVGSLGKLSLFLIGYVCFCTEIGPRIMKNRKPFKLARTIQLYNIFQVLANVYLVHEGIKSGWGTTISFKCEPVDYSGSETALRMRRAVWVYYIVKLTDLLDTVFFVLRKKYNQVTFLHIYHHTLMPICSYIGVTFAPEQKIVFSPFLGLLLTLSFTAIFVKVTLIGFVYLMCNETSKRMPIYTAFHGGLHIFHLLTLFRQKGLDVEYVSLSGGHGSLLGLINAFIHIILYLYYYLASLGPEVQKYLWWKKYVTKLQLVQFAIILVHNAQVIPRECSYPKVFNILLTLQAGYFIYLFGSFYVRAYIEKKPQTTIIKDTAKQKVEENGNTIIANGTVANGIANGVSNSHVANGIVNGYIANGSINGSIGIEKLKSN